MNFFKRFSLVWCRHDRSTCQFLPARIFALSAIECWDPIRASCVHRNYPDRHRACLWILYFRHDIIRILGAWFGSLYRQRRQGFQKPYGSAQSRHADGLVHHPRYDADSDCRPDCSSMRSKGSLRNLWRSPSPYLALFGVLLWVVDARSKQVKTMKEMTWKDALIFGIGQML